MTDWNDAGVDGDRSQRDANFFFRLGMPAESQGEQNNSHQKKKLKPAIASDLLSLDGGSTGLTTLSLSTGEDRGEGA